MSEAPENSSASLLSAAAQTVQAQDTGTTDAPREGADTGENQGTDAAPSSGPSWRDGLSDELKNDPTLARYKTAEDAHKALIEARKLVSRKAEGIVPPGPEAKPEEREAFLKAIGRPDTPDAYELPTMPEDSPAMPEEAQAQVREVLHKVGLTQDQFSQVFNIMHEIQAQHMQEQAKAMETARTETLAAIKKQFGPGKVDEVLASAAKGAIAVGGQAFLEALDESGAGNNPVVLLALKKVSDMLGESSMKGQDSQAPAALTEAEAKAKGREMMRDPRYFDPSRRDPAYVKQVERHFERYFPGEKIGRRVVAS